MSRVREVPNLDDLIRRYESGVSLKQISDESGLVRITLMRKFKQRGVELRGQSDAERLKWAGLREQPGAIEKQLSAAWTARRGSHDDPSVQVRRAITRMQRLTHRFRHEDDIAAILRARGFPVQQQQAVGPYNLDLALHVPRIAVEIVDAQMVAKRRDVFPKRVKYILDAGWGVLIVSLRTAPRLDYAAICEQIIACAKRSGRAQTLRGHYGVIGGHGQPLPRSSYNLHGWPSIL
jgi:very-short-patch-repair endonuclease